MSADEATRSFVALECEPGLQDALRELQARLRPRLGEARLVRPERIHLTLRFLGLSSPARLERLRPQLAAAAAACPPCEARVRGVGTFPDRGSPRVLWLGIELAEPLLVLQADCERAARAAGFDPEPRAFRAHLTLGRWRERAPRPELPEVDLGRTRLDTLTLFRSELRPDGAVYTPLARFPLAGSGDGAD
ncbi:MAG: RNA 2',3'-cyclic phosphodiesterase [Betaproteobacteria bacterium]